MKILVACEYSGRVRDAFRALGHHAVSCDILPTEAPGPHYQGDVRNLLQLGWDMMIAFPPCTHLSAVGANLWPQKRSDGRQQEAARFFIELYRAPIARVAIENPVGWMNTHWRKPDQIIQPFHFGDPWMKTTCLWLKGLPKLEHTDAVKPEGHWVNSGDYKKMKLPPRRHQGGAHGRSQSFLGIARAMADQWGSLDTRGKLAEVDNAREQGK